MLLGSVAHIPLWVLGSYPGGYRLATMRFPDEITHEARNRLRRAEGQVRGVQRLLDEGADCEDVIAQLAAAQAALHRAGLRLAAAGMAHCATHPEQAEADGMTSEKLEDLILKLR